MTTEEKAKAYDEALERAKDIKNGPCPHDESIATANYIFPQLNESEDERIRRTLAEYFGPEAQLDLVRGVPIQKIRDWLEKRKENPKSTDSIPADCVSDAKCENRWHKVQDSLPDNGRLVLAQDCLGNTLLARYDGEGNWEVSVYDNEDYYCRNTITKWCEIPSEKQKEQRPAEWSEEDEKRYNDLFWILYRSKELSQLGLSTGKSAIWWEDTIKWFNSFRSRPKSSDNWKPSEEQMEKLWDASKRDGRIGYVLRSLYNDLKKLM